MIQLLTSLGCGLLFGLGLILSGMVDPARVIGFLDITGQWDPSLALVMTGALLVFLPGYHLLVRPRSKPLLAGALCLSTRRNIDGRLLAGAALFGAGWGLAGICPGPAVVQLASGQAGIGLFFASMLLGIMLACKGSALAAWLQQRGRPLQG